jgi:hypothetical protein
MGAFQTGAADFDFRPVEQAAPSDWIIALGADARGLPRYRGSNQWAMVFHDGSPSPRLCHVPSHQLAASATAKYQDLEPFRLGHPLPLSARKL